MLGKERRFVTIYIACGETERQRLEILHFTMRFDFGGEGGRGAQEKASEVKKIAVEARWARLHS